MKKKFKIFSISALYIVSLGASAESSPYLDIRPTVQNFDVILGEANEYQGQLQYTIILADSDVWGSGYASCDSSKCKIVDFRFDSLIGSDATLTLSKDGTVVYAAPYGVEYITKENIFSDPFSLGKYVTFELEKEGYKENDLLEKIGTENIYKLYSTLSKIYVSSQYNIQEVISYIESSGWELTLQNTQPIKYSDELIFLKEILLLASNIPGINLYLGPLSGAVGDLKNFLDGIYKEPDITTNQIYQKLGEIEKKIDNISKGLDSFYDIYASNETRKYAIDIYNHFLLVNTFNNQIMNTIAPANDIINYINSSDLNRKEHIGDISNILNAEALRNLNQTAELMLGSAQKTSLLEGYASNLLFQISSKKNSGVIENYTTAYETYNNWLLQQYFSIVFTTAKSLYLELSALDLKMQYDAAIYPAADYGPLTTSDHYYAKAKYLTDVYAEKIEKLSQLLDGYLVSPDYSFKKYPEQSLLYNELDQGQASYVNKIFGEGLTNVVLANKNITAYYTYNEKSNGTIYFIPTTQEGDVFLKYCQVSSDFSINYCKPEYRVSNCYDSRWKVFPLGPDLELPKEVIPVVPLPENKKFEEKYVSPYGDVGKLVTNYYYHNTCTNKYNISLTSDEINSINKRIKQLRKPILYL